MRDQEIERWLILARRQSEQGQLEGATESLRRVLSIDPDEADAHALLALCLLDLKRVHAAAYEADMALRLEPESPLALQASAQVLVARRRFKEAEARFRELLEHVPGATSVYRSLADLYQLTGRRSEALEWIEKALELNPDAPQTWTDLGHWHLHRGDLDAAEDKARKALEISPEHHGGLILMGHVLLRRGKLEEAHDHAVWALRHDPSDHAALHLMTSIKACKNFFLGLWWRYSTWMGNLGDGRAILVLLGAYVVYRISAITADAYEQQGLAQYIQFLWLALVAYTWIGPAIFLRSLKKELATLELDKRF